MNKSIASQLVQGSHNIDRMKKEVHKVVTMLIGLVQPMFKKEISQEVHFNGGHWGIRTGKEGDGTVVYCWSHGNKSCSMPEYHSINGVKFHGNLEKVTLIYDNLDVLVRWMLKNFPGLEEKIAPILAATDKFENP